MVLETTNLKTNTIFLALVANPRACGGAGGAGHVGGGPGACGAGGSHVGGGACGGGGGGTAAAVVAVPADGAYLDFQLAGSWKCAKHLVEVKGIV